MVYFFVYSFCFWFCKILFRVKVIGRENIPREGSFIFASNHVSYIDPPVLAMGCTYKRRPIFLAKRELFAGRFFHWLFVNSRCIPLNRDAADISAIKLAIQHIRKGDPLVIFPEGERSPDGTLQKGLPGMSLLASKTQIPIVPAYIINSDKVFSPIHKFGLPKVYLNIGKPIFFPKDKNADYEEMTKKVMAAIQELKDGFKL